EAIAAYEKAIEIQPDYYYAWSSKGDALIKLERYEEAIFAYERALKINPEDFLAWYFRGLALIKLRRFKEGYASIMKSQEINPDFVEEMSSQSIKNILTKIGWYKLKEIFTHIFRIIGLKP
ncbi:tetratricopeptide repeat protein, partial [Dapis sp. BLCC M172]|uniref:tetratricopeptide repeat protein n=1 Tax=Dapis sp. BLCC M172 TaxID=2975281 RepID=UPI003CEFA8EB